MLLLSWWHDWLGQRPFAIHACGPWAGSSTSPEGARLAVDTAHNDGHELGNHTKSHQSSANSTDIQAAEDFIKATFGVRSYSFAAPNGDSSYLPVVPGMAEFLTNKQGDAVVKWDDHGYYEVSLDLGTLTLSP